MNDVSEAVRGKPVVVRARDAASLILLRGEGSDLELLAGRRPGHFRFMPGVWVFPGGALDRDDSRPWPVESGGDRLPPRLHRCARAALRETWEEVGVLVGRRADEPVALPVSATTPALTSHAPASPACGGGSPVVRSEIPSPARAEGSGRGSRNIARGMPHGDLGPSRIEAAYAEAGIAAALDTLTYVGRAITPTRVFRRFNTRFFLADGSAVFGEPASTEELEEVGWHPIGRCELAPFRDVSQFMLARALALRAGNASPEAPLFCSVGSRRRILVCREGACDL